MELSHPFSRKLSNSIYFSSSDKRHDSRYLTILSTLIIPSHQVRSSPEEVFLCTLYFDHCFLQDSKATIVNLLLYHGMLHIECQI